MRILSILGLSRELKMSRTLIRMYERVGIFPPARRDNRGERYYTEEDIKHLKEIRKMVKEMKYKNALKAVKGGKV